VPLLDEPALAAAMRGSDVVFHVAGVNTLCPADPSELERVNVGGAAAVTRAAAAAGVARLVHTSSASTIGEPSGTVGREDTPHRGWYLSDYDRTKHAGERAVLEIAAQEGLDVVCVNPASVQGPGRATGTAKMLLAQLDGRLKVFVDTRFSVVDIDDCTRGHLLAAERGRPGERYLLCGATLTSEEALALLRRLGGSSTRPRFVPRAVAPPLAAAVESVCRALHREPPTCRAMARTLLHGHAYDGSRATRELGLRYTPVEDTLRRTAAWAYGQGLLRRPLAG
jgi:dihydroflavonol-4-reductase